MKYLLPLWILINSRVSQVLGILEWTVIGKVTDYGQNVTLFCHVSNCCPQDSGWDRYSTEQHEQRTLFIDIKTGRPNKKYDGKVSRDGYTLIIQNLTKSDLNVSYSCVYGVTIGEIKFLQEEDVFKKKSSTQPDVPGSKIAAIIAGVLALVAVSIFIYVWTRRKKNRKGRGENKESKKRKMEKKHEQILQNGHEYIVMNLHDVERICEYLEADGILKENDLAEIKHQKSEQTRSLLSILPKRGTKAYDSFTDALKRTENTRVIDYLGQDNLSTELPFVDDKVGNFYWECPFCTFRYDDETSFCTVCYAWKCNNCNHFNDYDRSCRECEMCYNIKPQRWNQSRGHFHDSSRESFT